MRVVVTAPTVEYPNPGLTVVDVMKGWSDLCQLSV